MAALIWLAWRGAAAMGYNWQWYRVPAYFYSLTDDGFQAGEILIGLVRTVQISGLAFVLATLLGLVVALLQLSKLVVGSALALGFVEFVRNIPILVLLYLFYYVLGPVFGLDRFWASILCLAVFHAALMAEIFRAGINAIPQGQWDAAKALGLTPAQSYRHVVLPQSMPFILPPMTGEIVHVIKSSAIVSVIAVTELTTVGRDIISETYMSFEIWFTIAIVYFILTLTLSVAASRLETRYAARR